MVIEIRSSKLCYRPVVIQSNIVAAATGAALTPLLEDDFHKKLTIFTSYIILGVGLILSFCLMAVYFVRLLEKGVPGAKLGNSVWIIIGPIGHGANTILQLGRYVSELDWPETPIMEKVKAGISATSFLIGLMMWGFGLFWLATAALTSLSHTRYFSKKKEGLMFNLGYWTIIFPLATLTFATFQLTIYTNYAVFKWFSWVFGMGVVLGSASIHLMTIYHAFFKPVKFWSKFK